MIFISQEEELQINNDLQALYFYSKWLPFHKKMLTMIGKIEEKHDEIIFTAIDTDYFKSLCKRFNVESIPVIIIFKNGKEIKRINGLVMTSALKSAFVDI